MTTYTLDFQNGYIAHVVATDLAAAKHEALELFSYTNSSVHILNNKGELLSVARWYGVAPGEEDEPLLVIGNGFYAEWEDC